MHHYGPVNPPPPVLVDPSELRPRRKWFWIAGIVAGVGILVGLGGGIGLFVYGATSVMPDTRTTLQGTGTAAGGVRLTAGRDWAVFSTTDSSWEVKCAATGPGGRAASVTDPNETMNFTHDGATWHEVARVKAPVDGTYQMRCAPTGFQPTADMASARYMVGEAPSLGAFFGGLFGGFAVLFGVPFVAVLAAVIISVVTGVRRGNHRKRLLAERSGGYGPPGPPPPPYPA
jgi:ABC-type antimicrobial peptide transport system permease subunit